MNLVPPYFGFPVRTIEGKRREKKEMFSQVGHDLSIEGISFAPTRILLKNKLNRRESKDKWFNYVILTHRTRFKRERET